jgi:malate/lactate dehydrogenase
MFRKKKGHVRSQKEVEGVTIKEFLKGDTVNNFDVFDKRVCTSGMTVYLQKKCTSN